MAVNDFVRRSLQIVGGGIAQSTTDYFDNAVSFANDVKEVIDMGKQMGSDGAKKFNELRNSGIMKKARDWFYNEGGMFGDFDFDDDDFDAGFEIDSADSDNDNDSSSKPLSKDMMTDIAKKQTGAMYKAFGRQADLQIANTAEIISTINTRTAELTASVNNVNNTLIQIGKRLDLIVEWTSARTKKEEEEKIKSGILDYGGGISLTGVVNKAKENAEDSMLGTFLNIGKSMLGSGMLTPETVMSMILSQTILEKKWDKLGGKSVNDIGEFINDTVGEVIQNTMTKVLTSKNEILESLFEDIISRAGGKNYQNSVKNTYNDKPAVFDGMTRKSIITVIPGYLNEILKAVSKDGAGREVDSKGNLTRNKTNSFVKEVAENYFRSGTIDYDRRKEAATRTNLTEKEVADAMRTLTGCWVWYLYSSGRVLLSIGEVKNILAESTSTVVDQAAYMMATADQKHRSVEDWKWLYQGIIEQIDEFKYRQELQKAAERADKNLESFAKTNVNNHQAKKVDGSVMMQAFRHNFSEFNKDAKFRDPDAPSTGMNPTSIGSSSKGIAITELDYMAGIFDRLNRGLNVFITGQSNYRDKKYKKINMIPGYAVRKSKGGGTSVSDDSDESDISPVVDKLKNATSVKDKKKENMDDATKEAYEAKERGEELSKEQEKLLKDYNKQNGLFGAIGDWWEKHVEKSQREGIVSDPELYEGISKATDSVKNFFSDIIPESLKDVKEKIKGLQLYQDVTGSDTAKKVKEKASKLKENATDTLFGEKQTDAEGNEFRAEGLVQRAYARTGKAIGGVGGFINSHTPTKILENRTKKIIEDYGPDKTFDESDTDAQNMQVIATIANVAMSNGDYSTFDDQRFTEAMGAIKSPKLRTLLKRSVVPLMRKNSSVNDNGGKEGKDSKSTIGKLLSIALGAAKMIVTPVIAIIRGAIVSIFGIAKYGLGSILKLSKKMIKNANVRLISGIKSFAHGAKQAFTPIMNRLGKFVDHLYSGLTKIKKFYNTIKKGITEGIGKVFTSIKDKLKKTDTSSNAPKVEKNGFLSQQLNKLKNSDFGRGFTKAMNDSKIAQEQAKIKQEAEGVKQGMDQSQLMESIQQEDGKVPFFKKIISLIKGIKDNTDNISKDDDNRKSNQNKNGSGGGNAPTTPDINDEPETPGTNLTNPTTSTNGEAAGQLTSGVAGVAGAVAGVVSGAGSVLGGIGEMLGGMTNIMGAILQYVLSIVMAMEGVKVFMEMVQSILKAALEPISEIIMGLNDLLKPFIKSISKVLKEITNIVKIIVKSITDVIEPLIEGLLTPVLEALMPAFQAIIDILSPILKIIGVVLKVILAPLFAIFKSKLMPAINIIVDVLQVVMGVVQIIGGVLMSIGGAIASILGVIVGGLGKFIPGLGKVGSNMQAKGEEMSKSGPDMIAEGLKAVAQGGVNLALDYASFLTFGLTDAILDRNQEETKEPKKIEPGDTNAVETTFANGDVTNIYNNGSSDVYNTYGGEYQRGMGGYLNMNQRGCGPIALADMYNRSGGNISARSLAGSMYGSGRYDPRRGTSVGDYIDTARSMGMNLTPGKVTQQSLKYASPNRPITVVGSGSDYGTRRGNNHFMNVIGTDSHGTAFVSNPLTGRIDRKPASTVAGSAVMGLYGSGDENDDGYTFPQAIKEAFQKLKAEAAKVLGLFTMEKSDEEETNDIINDTIKKESSKNSAQQMKMSNPDLYEEYEAVAKAEARKDYETMYPKKDGQSDDDYEKGFENFWNSNAHNYLSKAVVNDVVFGDAVGNDLNDKSGYDKIASTSNSIINAFNERIEAVNAAAKEGASTAEAGGLSANGSGRGNINDLYEAASQVWEAAGNKLGAFYAYDNHGPITTRSGVTLPEVHPDCSGMISAAMNYMGYDFRGTMNGSNNRWTTHDLSGKTKNDFIYKDGELTDDWAIIPYSPDEVREGDILTTAGHVGLHVLGDGPDAKGFDAGSGERLPLLAQGAAKAYLDGDTDWRDKLTWTMGPGYSGLTTILRYVKSMPGQGKIDMSGLLGDHSAWPSYSGNAGVPTFINAGKAAGMSGAEIATLISTGIWEDNGKKIFGLKSLNDTTYDYNGQAAKGIMNWVDQNVNYGNTVQDQLKYIHNTYFDESSTDWRAKVRDNGFVTQDTQAFKEATGRSKFELNMGDRYGPYTDKDLIEGSAWFFMDALVPEKIHTAKGMAENVGTAADAYNWMIDNGYIDVDESNPTILTPTGSGSGITGYGMVNSNWDAQVKSNIEQIGTASGKNTGIVNTVNEGLMLKAKPDLDSARLIEIPKGTKLNLETSGSKDWFKTSFGGKTGYVYAQYIKLDKNETTNAYKTQNFDYETLAENQKNYDTLNQYANASTGGGTGSNDHKGDAQWYQTSGGDWKFDDKVLAANDPKWRSAWYNESTPLHVNEFYKGFDALQHMTSLASNPNVRGGVYYNNLVEGYGGGSDGRDAVASLRKECGTADDWKKSRDNYISKYSKSKRINAPFVEDLNTLHNAFWPNNKLSLSQTDTRVKGSGDVYSEDEFWNDYIGWNNMYNTNISRPMSDGSDTMYDSGTFYDAETGTTVVNNYRVTRTEDKVTEARLKAILANTYNVRSESMEALLMAILDELKKRKGPRGEGNDTNGSQKLFDERIPAQVTRLSIG